MTPSNLEQPGTEVPGEPQASEGQPSSVAAGEDGASMAVQSKDLRTLRSWFPEGSPWIQRATMVVYGVTALLAVLALYAAVGGLVERARVSIDDMRYGRPRTTHIEGFVGHGEDRGAPTHLMAINLNRRIVLVEFPGGEPSVARVVEGPYLFGADETLTPIDLQLRDIDGDGVIDLLVTIRREQIVYLNKDGVFRLPTAAEQVGLSRGQP